MKFKKLSLVISCLILLQAGTSFRPNYEIGDTVSDFTLRNVDGKMIALSSYRTSAGVIVIFDCNTCPYSSAYNDRIIALNKKYSPQGFPVLTINSNDPEISSGDSFEDMVAKARDKNYDFPYLQDDTQKIGRAFGATNTPHVFVLKRNGNNFFVAYSGTIDNNARDSSRADKKYVEDAVNALLLGKLPVVQKTKAVGCGIVWKDI